jgi:hypothetical protein
VIRLNKGREERERISVKGIVQGDVLFLYLRDYKFALLFIKIIGGLKRNLTHGPFVSFGSTPLSL